MSTTAERLALAVWPETHPPLALAATAILVAYLAILGLGEALRRAGLPGSTTRRITHMASTLPALGAPWLFASAEPVFVLAAGFSLLMVGSRRLELLGSIHDIPRRSVGAVLYPVAVAVTFALAPGAAEYVIAVIVLGFGDGAAGIVGETRGARGFLCWGARRSLEGSIAAAIVSGLAAMVVLVAFGRSDAIELAFLFVVVAAAAALAEAGAPYGADNLAMPAAALAVVSLPAVWALLVVLALTGWVAAGLAWSRGYWPGQLRRPDMLTSADDRR